jgi:peroxiredoxin
MPKLATGQLAPDFQLPGLDGNPTRLADLRGQIILINFWSAECPWVERIDREFGARPLEGLVVLAIASNASEPPDLLRQAAQDRKLPHVLVDAGHRVADLYGAETTPHAFLIDTEGILRYQGAFDDVTFRQRTPTRSYAREAVRAVQRGRPVEIEETQPYGCAIIRFSEE